MRRCLPFAVATCVALSRGRRRAAGRAESHEPAIPEVGRARAAHGLHAEDVARRHAARLVHHARPRLVGRDLLRPARRDQPERQQHRAATTAITYRVLKPATEMQIDLMEPLEVDSMVQDGTPVRFRREGDAFFATLTVAAARGRSQDDHRLLSRPSADREEPALAGRIHLGEGQPRPPVGRDDRSGHGRVGVVAEQGHAGRRAGQPARRAHAARSDDGRLERTAAQHDAQRRTARRPTSGSSSNPINNYAIAVAAGTYAHYTETYDGLEGHAHDGLLAARLQPRRTRTGSGRRRAR